MIVFNKDELEFIKAETSFIKKGHECFQPTYKTTQIIHSILNKIDEELQHRRDENIEVKDGIK